MGNKVTFKAELMQERATKFLKHRFTVCENKLSVMIDEATAPITFLGFKLPIRRPTREEARRDILADPARNPYWVGSYYVDMTKAIVQAPPTALITVSDYAFSWLSELP